MLDLGKNRNGRHCSSCSEVSSTDGVQTHWTIIPGRWLFTCKGTSDDFLKAESDLHPLEEQCVLELAFGKQVHSSHPVVNGLFLTGPAVPVSGKLEASQCLMTLANHTRKIEHRGNFAAWMIQIGGATWVILDRVMPKDPFAPRRQQAREVFYQMEEALVSVGLTFHHVVRTWFFIDRINEWYGEFNKVRNEFYHSCGIAGERMPASTAVGCGNSLGYALVGYAIAVVTKQQELTIRAVPSPLQCPATKYGSSFSRALELANTFGRYLIISGTASIGRSGQTLHAGDFTRQVLTTVEVVKAILDSQQMSWADVVRAIAYVKDHANLANWQLLARKAGLPLERFINVACEICRPELVFELELDAASTAKNNP